MPKKNSGAPSVLDSIKGTKKRGGKKHRKYGRNIKKCAAYRSRVGKPNGRGVAGNKKGKKHLI